MAMTTDALAVPLRQRVAGEVRAFMARHGLSQSRLADLLHWRQQYLSRRLTGTVPFDTDDLAALAEIFGVRPEDFLRGPSKPGKRPGVKTDHSLRRFLDILVITPLSFLLSPEQRGKEVLTCPVTAR